MNIRKMIFISLFAAIMCILSPFAFPVGTVPVTLSVFAVFLTALCLPGYASVTATFIYILLGAVGLPVFSGFKGGLSVLFGATGGFIWSYPIMALIIVILQNKNRFFALTASLLLCYISGTAQLMAITGLSFTNAVIFGVLPFIPFDLFKIALALLVSKPLKKACASFYKFS